MSAKKNKRVYLSPPHLGDQEWEFIKDALDSNWIAPLGPHVDAFEKEIAAYVDIENAVALSSGTAALHLALKLCNIKPGDRVFCSDLTFVSCANVILYENAIPVFIDSDWESWTMCPKALQQAFDAAEKQNQLPKAVIVTDLYGQSADYDALTSICDHYNVPIIEDAAEAVGGVYKNKKCGNFGKMAVLSFNGNKIMTTSGGGMLLSNNSELIAKARFLSNQARDNAVHYEHSELGYNYRMSNILAALGRGQLQNLDTHIRACEKIFNKYMEELSNLPGIEFFPIADYGQPNYWLSVCLIDPVNAGIHKDEIIDLLEEKNIESRPVWKPMHLQPLYKDYQFFAVNEPDISTTVFKNGICLPSGVGLANDQQNQIISLIRSQYLN